MNFKKLEREVNMRHTRIKKDSEPSVVVTSEVDRQIENIELQEQSPVDDGGTTEEQSSIIKHSKCVCSHNFLRIPHVGLLFALMASFLFSVDFLIAKLLDVNVGVIGTYRFSGFVLGMSCITIYNRQHPFPRGKRSFLILRGVSGTLALVCAYIGYQNLPMGDAAVFSNTTPVVVSVVACICLHEPCKITNVVILLVAIVGVFLLAQPSFIFGYSKQDEEVSGHKTVGIITSLASAIFNAAVFIFVRMLKDVAFSVIQLSAGIAGVIVCPIFELIRTRSFCIPECGMDRLMTVGIMTFATLAGVCSTMSLKLEPAGPVSLVRVSDSVFAFMWQITVFKDIPSTIEIVGAAIVLLCILLEAVRNTVLSLPENSKIRKRLWILTK